MQFGSQAMDWTLPYLANGRGMLDLSRHPRLRCVFEDFPVKKVRFKAGNRTERTPQQHGAEAPGKDEEDGVHHLEC